MTQLELLAGCRTAHDYAECYAYARTDQEREDVMVAVRDADLSIIGELLKIAATLEMA